MNITVEIRAWAQRAPNLPAVLTVDASLTFAELDQAVSATAGWFRREGLVPGDIVGIHLPNQLQHFVTTLALARLGACQVTLYNSDSHGIVQELTKRLGVVATVAHSSTEIKTGTPRVAPPAESIEEFKLLEPGLAEFANDGALPFIAQRSSGTTGIPKLSLLTHEACHARLEFGGYELPSGPECRYLALSNISFNSVKRRALMCLTSGGCVTLFDAVEVSAVIDVIAKHRINYLSAVPTHAVELLKVAKDNEFLFPDLRVRPGTLCRITEFSEHESNGRELDEGERVAVEVLPVLGQSAAAVEPGDGAFDHPTPGLDDEALHPIGSLDDLGLEIGQDAGQGAVKDRALIGAVGEQFPEKGKQTEQGRQQRETAVAILNVGGGDDAVQQQALRIDQNTPLLALDQLAGIEAVAVDASPPFSALFTL